MFYAGLRAAGDFYRWGVQRELSGYDTGTPSGWTATSALMAAFGPRFADEFWEAVEDRGGLKRRWGFRFL